MSIYATLWCLKFPKDGFSPIDDEWIEVIAQAVPAHVGSPTPGEGYEDGDPFAEFLPPPVKTDGQGNARFMRAVATIKNELSINIELASPSDFIPELPEWRQRCLFISRHGLLDFFHYDPYSQALSKLERGHSRDLADVEAMLRDGLVRKDLLLELFGQIEPTLIRYPALDPASFREIVVNFCKDQFN